MRAVSPTAARRLAAGTSLPDWSAALTNEPPEMDAFEAGFQEFLTPSRFGELADYLMTNLPKLELPERGAYRGLLAATLFCLGRMEEAALHYEQAVRETPSYLGLRNVAARFFIMNQPDLERAREMLEILPLEESCQSDAADPHKFLALLGTVLYLQGEITRGLENLRAAYSEEMSRTIREPDITPLTFLRYDRNALPDDDWQALVDMVSRFEVVDMDSLQRA